MFVFHRKVQFDITKGGVDKPFVVIGWKTPDSYSRLFCLWKSGVWIRLRGNKRFCMVWARVVEHRDEAVGEGAEETPKNLRTEDDVEPAGQICPRCRGAGQYCDNIGVRVCGLCNGTGQI